jgi:general secretion pathway protein L
MQGGAPALRSVIDGTRRFLGWWQDELWGMVPERVRRLLAGGDAGIVLAQVDGGFAIIDASAGRAGRRPAHAHRVLPRAEALAALEKMTASRRLGPVGIRLPLSRCFERRVELPKAAGDDVRRMLDFDLERATPFRLGEVYTAHLLAGVAAVKGKQRLRQLVVKREAVDPLLADVRAAGVEPAFVDCWQATPSSGLPVNFLETGGPQRSGLARHLTLPRTLAALALVLAGLAFFLAQSRYDSALADLRAQTARMRAEAAAVRGAQERSDTAVADLARLQRMKLDEVPAVEVLEELSKVLPDSVWLSDLRIEGDTLDITGLAKSGAALPSLFVGSALFSDAALTAPLTLDPREDRERFSLRLRIKRPAASRHAAAGREAPR